MFRTGLEELVKAAAALPAARTIGPHPFMSAARALPGRMWGAAKKPLALGAVGAAGALAYGMHQQNADDRANNQLVYAPMQGTGMG